MKTNTKKILATLLTVTMACTVLLTVNWTCFADEDVETAWEDMTEEEQYNASMEEQAEAVGLDVESFHLFANVVEAESDRSYFEDGETTDGRIYVASCIWSRVFSKSFPNTVTGVLTASGQFTTVSGGWCSTSCTKASRWAIIKGLEYLLDGTIPNNMYWFNCIAYFQGFNAYMKVGDNYFSTSGEPTYFSNAVVLTNKDGSYEIRNVFKLTILEEIEHPKLKRTSVDCTERGEEK